MSPLASLTPSRIFYAKRIGSISNTTMQLRKEAFRTERQWCGSTSVCNLDTLFEFLLMSTGHCINQLRQVIMCKADLGVFGQVWVDKIEQPFVDFNTKHMCKNYATIQRKAEEFQIAEGEKLMLRLQDGDIRLPEIP